MDSSGLEQFFRDYGRAAMGDDPAAIAAFYAESFLVAGPQGSATFPNDDQFLAWLRRLHDFNRQAGMLSMEPVAVAGTAVAPGYDLARVTWGARFQKTGDELIRFAITYIIRHTDQGPKLIAYISHEDQEEAMRAHGLL
jgi:hypothetical protein